MAGTIIADKIQTENAFLTLNVGQTLVATINSSGILNSSGGTMIGANGSVSNTAITGLVTAAQIANVANTQLTGLIQAAQIGSANATLITSGTLPGARLPANSVLQVVHTTYTTQQSSVSATYADSGLSASITPTSSSSKILVIVSHNGNLVSGAQNAIANFRLLRGSTPIINEFAALGNSLNNIEVVYGAASASYLDSPATTSSTTYKTQFKNKYAAGTVYTNAYDAAATMTLLEIAG